MAQKKKNTKNSAEKQAAKEKAAREKNLKLAAYIAAGVAVFVGLFFGILALSGVFSYTPEATNHASVLLDNGYTLHIELYGKDADVTVNNFLSLCQNGYLEGKTLHTVKDGRLYGGSLLADGGKNGIKGEFLSNGIKNKVPMEKGTIVMARGENYDSAYGQFFILTEDEPELEGEYAAFGKITDLEILEKIMKDVKVDEHGIVKSAPKILTVSLHDAHH